MSKPKRILVIEDHKALRILLSGILKKDFDVTTKIDGLDAMAYLASGHLPDIILLDVEMPKMDGLALIKNLSCSGFFKNIPIIVISGNDDELTKEKCYNLGVKHYFTKPFNPKTLKNKINEVLESESLLLLAS